LGQIFVVEESPVNLPTATKSEQPFGTFGVPATIAEGYGTKSGNRRRGDCSEHGPICHLFELILVIHANTSNETNHIV
jgi:hypothetical protein